MHSNDKKYSLLVYKSRCWVVELAHCQQTQPERPTVNWQIRRQNKQLGENSIISLQFDAHAIFWLLKWMKFIEVNSTQTRHIFTCANCVKYILNQNAGETMTNIRLRCYSIEWFVDHQQTKKIWSSNLFEQEGTRKRYILAFIIILFVLDEFFFFFSFIWQSHAKDISDHKKKHKHTHTSVNAWSDRIASYGFDVCFFCFRCADAVAPGKHCLFSCFGMWLFYIVPSPSLSFAFICFWQFIYMNISPCIFVYSVAQNIPL